MPRPTGIWMPLYVADYYADTRHLNTEEHGAYLLLLMAYWRRGEALPDDDAYLAGVAGLSKFRWKNFRKTLSGFFSVNNGVWTHKRMEKEILRSFERSTKAKRSINARWARVKQVTVTDHSSSKNPSNGAKAPPPSEVLAPSTLEQQYFRRVKELCGEKSGGALGAMLLKAKNQDVAEARVVVEIASKKENPTEYIGAAIRGKRPEEKQTGLRKVNGKWVDSW